MNARERLSNGIWSALHAITNRDTADLPVLDLPLLSIDLPAFGGRCELVPHAPDVLPTGTMTLGYLDMTGEGKSLRPAFYKGGAWVGRDLKPLQGDVKTWYHVRPVDDG